LRRRFSPAPWSRFQSRCERDALQLTPIEFLRANGQTVTLASFDERLLVAARARHVPVYEQ
jgi:hypothetical protein